MDVTSDLRVRSLGPDDWQVWRDVRLAALAQAPEAFGSTLAQEQSRTEAQWRDWLHPDRGLKAVALSGNDGHASGNAVSETAGLVGGWVPDPGIPAAVLFSMWVRPSARGRGIGDLLVVSVLDWALRQRYASISLTVVDGNERAARLYARHGFRLTGQTVPHPNDPAVVERIMERVLTS